VDVAAVGMAVGVGIAAVGMAAGVGKDTAEEHAEPVAGDNKAAVNIAAVEDPAAEAVPWSPC